MKNNKTLKKHGQVEKELDKKDESVLAVNNFKGHGNELGRRSFIKDIIVFAGGLGICGNGLSMCRPAGSNIHHFEVIGKVKPRKSTDISSSVLGVGFETLDRKLFDPEKCYKPLNELGIKWARCQTGWNRCEVVKGQYDFKWLDEVVDNLQAVGIQPWLNVGYGNALYTPGAINNSAVGWVPDNSDEARKGWENFIHALATHYKERVHHYEIWNESNISTFWKPEKSTPEDYVGLVKRSAKVIKKVYSNAIIIGGAFSGIPTGFFEECLKLGMTNYVDKISFHPYQNIPEADYKEKIGNWKNTLKQYRQSPELWQGECGCPSTDNSVGALSKLPWNESRQARWLLRRVINDLRLNLGMTSWYHTCDQEGYGKAVYKPSDKVNAYFGLLRLEDYSPKPSYFAYQNMCALFDIQTQLNSTIEMKFESNGVISQEIIEQATFSRDAKSICAYWLPADVHDDTEDQQIDVTIDNSSFHLLQTPVLIDPLSGVVTKLAGNKKDNGWHFSSIPLKDYPTLIADLESFLIVK